MDWTRVGILAGPDHGEHRRTARKFHLTVRGVRLAGELPDGGSEPARLHANFTAKFGRWIDAPAGRESRRLRNVRGQIGRGIGEGFPLDELLQGQALPQQLAGVVGRNGDGLERLLQIGGISFAALGVLRVAQNAADLIGQVVHDAGAQRARDFQRRERSEGGGGGVVHKMGSGFEGVEFRDDLFEVLVFDSGSGAAFGHQSEAMAVQPDKSVEIIFFINPAHELGREAV